MIYYQFPNPQSPIASNNFTSSPAVQLGSITLKSFFCQMKVTYCNYNLGTIYLNVKTDSLTKNEQHIEAGITDV